MGIMIYDLGRNGMKQIRPSLRYYFGICLERL